MLREAERARGEFGDFSGAGTGGGPSPKSAIDALKFTTKAKATKGGGSNKAEPYRGVFWAYQNSTGSATWAQPNISDVVRGQSETAVALTGMASKAGSSPATIVIQGYQKDKMDLARAVVSELGRLNRQAH